MDKRDQEYAKYRDERIAYFCSMFHERLMTEPVFRASLVGLIERRDIPSMVRLNEPVAKPLRPEKYLVWGGKVVINPSY